MAEHASAQALRAFQEVIASLFEPGWIEDPKNRDHPAVRRIGVLRRSAEHDIPSFLNWAGLRELARAGLDATAILQASGGSPKALRAGTFANYGDERVLNRLSAVVRNPEQYQDAMVELTYAAWHLAHQHRVRAFEDDGLADFRAECPLSELPILADCKSIHESNSLRNFDAIIASANRQIKAHREEGIGVAVVDASDLVKRVRFLRPGEEKAPITPPEIRRVRDACAREMIGSNKSVSVAVVLWIDLSLQFHPDHRAFVLRANRYGYCHEHPRARHLAPEWLVGLHYKGNGSYGFTVRPTSSSTYERMVAEFLRQDGVK